MNNIKLYSNKYLQDCLKLFRSNVPAFFDKKEESLFENFLVRDCLNYFLLFDMSYQLVAAGGYELEKQPNTISLTWGMVHALFHKNGYGTVLTDFRLNSISNTFPKCDIILNTSQKTFRFYEKFGFELIKITNDYYGLGLDRYDMIKCGN